MKEDPVNFSNMRWFDLIASLVFVAFAGVQLNDPDSLPWMIIYGGTGLLSLAAFFGHHSSITLYFWLMVCLMPAIPLLEDLRNARLSSFASYGMADLAAERAREGLGLLVCAAWTLRLCRRKAARVQGTTSRLTLILFSCGWLSGCVWATAPDPNHQDARIRIPHEAPQSLQRRRTIARNLDNPRGVLIDTDGTLLVAVAGKGLADSDGGILRFQRAEDGSYQDPANILSDQASTNLLSLVRRDEVFGVAAIKRGEQEIRATAAYYEGPSRVFIVERDNVKEVGRVPGNLNDIAWHPTEKVWFGVSSSTNELVRLGEHGGSSPVTAFRRLANGQEAVPGYLRHDPRTGDMLVSLFSGSPLGEAGGDGTEIEARAGKIVRVNPRTGETSDMIEALTAPTDLEVSDDGRTLWVLELCDSFLDPVASHEEMVTGSTHGGFRRFSGRLLQIDRESGNVVEIANQLDTPTNLTFGGGSLLVSTGMGTSGRAIPTPENRTRPLEGQVEAIEIPAQGP